MGPSLGQISRLLEFLKENRVSGNQLQGLFDSGLLSDLFRARVDEVSRPKLREILGLRPMNSSDFKALLTVSLGMDPQEPIGTRGTRSHTADELGDALLVGGFHINDWAIEILRQPAFKMAIVKTEVDLVAPSVAEMGFPQGATRLDIFRRAVEELGLELCPAEVGPWLRLQYKDQPRHEVLSVGMEPIVGSRNRPLVFEITHNINTGPSLDGRPSHDNDFWFAHNRCVFIRPR